MWNIYLDEVKEGDMQLTEAWINDSNGVLAFVCPDLLILLFITMTTPT